MNIGKDLVFSRIKTDAPGPGYCHFPNDENRGYDGHYYAGLISERRKSKIKGGKRVMVWEKPDKAHNEPFDLRVYNTAAIRLTNPNWEQLRHNRKAAGGRVSGVVAPPAASPAARTRAASVVVDNSASVSRVTDGVQLIQV